MDWNLIWTAVGAIGGTLGAFATAIAVIVALWQTRFNYKKKLKLSFTDNIIVVPEKGSFYKKYVGITVANIGNRDVVIKNWGFDLDDGTKMLIVQDTSPIGRALQVTLPHRLIIEDSTTLYYEKEVFIDLIKELSEKRQIDLKKKIPFFVEDSTGKKHKVLTNKIAKDLLEGTERDSNTVCI